MVVWKPEALHLLTFSFLDDIAPTQLGLANGECQGMASWAQSRPSKPLHRNRFLRH